MAETIAFKYRAFLSYSHRDTAWAKWLHSRLEAFRIDKDLIGRETPVGPVPTTLRPIFHDRGDFSGGSTLTAATITALDASAALIVLCSTVSAGRPAVNEEVRLFRSRHPNRPVIPVIIEGTFPENFPPALRYEFAVDGTITDRPVTILGPDLREGGDGKNLGLAKTVAGLTGVAPDDVYRRAERERRKQGRLRAAVVAMIIALAFVGAGFYWQSYRQKQTLAEITALVDKYSLVSSAQAAADPGAKESLAQAITSIAEGAATDPRYAQALALLKAGKPDEAEPLLKAVAEDKEKRADKDAKDAAAAYRNLASIAYVSAPGRAREYYARAARLDPTDVAGMFENGWFQQQAGQLDAAQAAYASVLAALRPSVDDNRLIWAKFGMGGIEQARGALGVALETYHEAETIADRLAKTDSSNAVWQRDLSVSHLKVGDVQVAQGNLPEALTSYQASLAIADRLARSHPSIAVWQLDLAQSYSKVGDVQMAQGNLPEALTSYQASLAIADRLAKSDPGNTGWQRDLSVSYNDVGNVQFARGDVPAAMTSYQADLAIMERLAKSDPANADWQRNLSISYDKLGDVQIAQGNLPEALTSYQTSLAIADRIAKSDPSNTGWQRDLSVSYNRVGDAQLAHGDVPVAMASYQASLDIRERLAKSDPGNAGWQLDLSLSYNKIGAVQAAQGNLPAALTSYQASLAIRERLAKSDPGNAGWQYDLAISYATLADSYLKSKQVSQAKEALAAGRAILAPLTERHQEFAQWQRSLAWFDQQIASLKN